MANIASLEPTMALPPSLQYELDMIKTLAVDYRTTRILWIVSLAVLLYDYLLTFNAEIVLYRTRRLKFTHALFILNRYWALLHLIVDNTALAVAGPPKSFCSFFFNWICYGGAPIHITTGVILTQRLYAMYGCKRPLLFFLLGLLVTQVVAETVVMGPIVARMQPITLLPEFTGCIPDKASNHIWAYWVPVLGVETTIFGLAILKVFTLARNRSHPPLILTVLLRDCIIYFGGVLVTILANLVIWYAARPSLIGVALGPAIATPSILGCRMLLNTHSATQSTYAGGISLFHTTITWTQQQSVPLRFMHPSEAHEVAVTETDSIHFAAHDPERITSHHD